MVRFFLPLIVMIFVFQLAIMFAAKIVVILLPLALVVAILIPLLAGVINGLGTWIATKDPHAGARAAAETSSRIGKKTFSTAGSALKTIGLGVFRFIFGLRKL